MFVPNQKRAITVCVMVEGNLKKLVHHVLNLERGLA